MRLFLVGLFFWFVLLGAGCNRASGGEGWDRAVERVDELGTASAATAEARTAAANVGGTRRPGEPTVSSGLAAVRNDCGQCGTDSPVGGWENDAGDALILNEDGTYLALTDGAQTTGAWELSGLFLCLTPDGGAVECQRYRQNIDAMSLGTVLFIRQ